jgi:hypothetical protein
MFLEAGACGDFVARRERCATKQTIPFVVANQACVAGF